MRMTNNKNKRSDSLSDAEESHIQVADTKLLSILNERELMRTMMPMMKVVFGSLVVFSVDAHSA